MSKTGNRFIIFSGIILLLILVLENINGRFWLSDFKVYYGAAKAFIHHERVYGPAFGEDTGVYKYSPFLLFIFAPFTFLPFQMAAVIHYLICAISLVLLILQANKAIVRLCGRYHKSDSLIMGLAFVVALSHIFRELHLGNVNIIVALLLVVCADAVLDNKAAAAGWLFALCLFFKPYFLILVIPLVLFRKYRVLLHSLIAAGIFLILSGIIMGLKDAIWMHEEWIHAMRNHSVFLQSYQSAGSILKTYTGIDAGFTLPGIIGGIVIGILFIFSRKNDYNKDGGFFFSWILLLALIPSLVVTDTNHFLLALPLICFLLQIVPSLHKSWLTILMVIVFLMYDGNSPEWLGQDLSDKLERAGMLGISNLLLVVMGLIAFHSVNSLQNKGVLKLKEQAPTGM